MECTEKYFIQTKGEYFSLINFTYAATYKCSCYSKWAVS